ncbi:MAG: hypothetical protein J6U00_00565 [Ruminococcus sp.]|jgi:uncharacterized membrane protein YcgQ (UPF0703/DUF1980 family)|uniref:hypothetical protein n=1 Tax=Ruminococcus sp. TaxID=41978 RepID=UPI001B2EAC20|nr:hypothetical protein [Ruminococcus sp.]MBO7472491.1 hypothetical protein [Ruminococcus sp.]
MKSIRTLIALIIVPLCLFSCSNATKSETSSTPSYQSSDEPPIGGIKPKDEAFKGNGEYDVDLTQLNSSMVYAQVSDMMNYPDNYKGKSVKANGTFAYFKDDNTGNEYFSVVIKDATACCAQGLEFVLDGDYTYPKDYPAQDANITVTGNFDYYTEGDYRYARLTNAKMDVGQLSW